MRRPRGRHIHSHSLSLTSLCLKTIWPVSGAETLILSLVSLGLAGLPQRPCSFLLPCILAGKQVLVFEAPTDSMLLALFHEYPYPCPCRGGRGDT